MRSRREDQGYSMLGLLLAIVILGVLAVIAVSQMEQVTTSRSAGKNQPPSGPSGAAVAACLADYHSVELLLQLYRTEHQTDPPAGTAWALSLSSNGTEGQTWPSSPSYAISWDGAALSVNPSSGRASSGSSGTASPPTGCFAA